FLYEREKRFSETTSVLSRRCERLEADNASLMAAFQEKIRYLESVVRSDYAPAKRDVLALLPDGSGLFTVAHGTSAEAGLWSGSRVRAEKSAS
ncbi:hypothetical protein, partial [Streptomyces caniscabiei]|uniref:hypothetical protein n=1 Tax=Streptomyces caniscabiei TaxID=2746961 RepID=UPI0038F6C3C4